jgi:putative glycosyltransferase (TIGR04372 family)
MILRRLRKLLKPRLKRYPIAFRLYEAISWTFTRSRFASSTKRFFAKIANVVFPMWIAPRFGLAYNYALAGDVRRAMDIADDVLARQPDLYDSRLYRIASVYTLQGRYDEAFRLFQRMEERRREIAHELQYDRLGLRFFPSAGFFNIGHLGLLDKYIKAEMLGMIPRRSNVLLGASENSANPAYLRYWEKYFSLISDPRTISLLAPLSDALQEHISVVRVGERTRNVAALGRDVHLRWEAEGRGPLLELSAEHREGGYRRLRELGVPESAWFVGLHVRESKDRMRDVRNADITTYGLAIEEVAKRGGWVVRMGDRSMRPMPSYPHAVDYAHSIRREDWMDVFLWAEGRFFIGSASGPQIIPTTFGKPVAIANYGPIANFFCGQDDILLPKNYWLEKERRYLTLPERVHSDHGFRESIDAFASIGIRVVDNSPEELRELVAEMIDWLEGRREDTPAERALQVRFAELSASHDVYPAKVAHAFMSRYPDLFGA